MWLAIVISLSLMTFLFFVASALIKNEEYMPVKGLFFILGIIHSLILGMLPVVISLNPSDSSSFYPIAVGYLAINGISIILLIYLRGFILIKKIFSYMNPQTKK